MSDKTGIEWTDATWNPLRGCSKVSEGCRNCYAETMANRFSGPGQSYEGTITDGRWNGQIRLVPEVLGRPIRWARPRRIFVNSMSDLFHPNVPFEYIDKVFAVMALAPQHTFQILTKRSERMMEYLTAVDRDEAIGWKAHELYELIGGDYSYIPALITREGTISSASIQPHKQSWPLPNVWLGVSVENQKAADERIPLLLQTPAAVRFLSMEPLLGPVDLKKIKTGSNGHGLVFEHDVLTGWSHGYNEKTGNPKIMRNDQFGKVDWVIVGGESGLGARPMHPNWVRDIRDQCQEAGVPFFFKQWGEVIMPSQMPPELYYAIENFGEGIGIGDTYTRVGKKRAGRLLDGRTWDEYPEVEA